MLEKAADELGGWQGESAALLILAVLVLEGDLSGLIAEETLTAQGGVIDVSREILEGGLATACGLHIHYPRLFPNLNGQAGILGGVFLG